MSGTWWRLVALALALACALAACNGNDGDDQNGGYYPGARCNGSTTTLSCCEHDCDNDIFSYPSCVNGQWVCPPDYVSSMYCPGPRFCLGPLPLIDAGTGNPCDDSPGLTLTCCVGGCMNHVTTSPVCDASGWHCLPGTVSEEDCPGQPFCLGS